MTALLAVLLACLGPQAAPPGDAPPNVVLFLVDDMGWRDAGFQGSRYYETPHVDRLAAGGMVFTRAYSNGPNCAPSRASLMTGLYPPRHGIYTVGSPARGKARERALIPVPNETVLAAEFVTLAEALAAAGYATAALGKWHLGPDPLEQGFQLNAGGNQTGSPRGGHFSPYANPQLPDGPDGECLTDRLTDEAVGFIAEHASEPFFLYVSHYAVHTPIESKPELSARYEAKEPDGGQDDPRYAGMIESVDQSLGRVLDALAVHDLEGRTLVLFTSDNGGHGGVTSNAPLRGAKGMLYEGGIRVPFAVRWPGVVESGGRCAVPVAGHDLFPTLLEAAGVPVPDGLELDGVSLVPLLEGTGGVERELLFWHFPAYLEAGRRAGVPWRTTPAGAVLRGDLKLLEFFEDGRLELYDLAADPGEERDLAGTRPELAAELHGELLAWRAAVGAPVPTEPNPAYDPEAGGSRDER